MPPLRPRWLCVLASSCAPALATQSTFLEVEPNGTKAEAVVVTGFAAGDVLSGTSTGASTAPGDAGPASADTYRITTAPLPPGVWKQRLLLSTAGADEFTLTVRGLSVSGPAGAPAIVAGSDTALQYAAAPGGARQLVWYGFGRPQELFVRVAGTANTTLPYALTLAVEPVAATVLPAALRSGPITITTVGQGHNTDTELFVLDHDLVPIPGWRNDDDPGGPTAQSRLARVVPAGVYHLAVGRFNVADHLLSGADDDYPLAPVLDFPDTLLSWSASGSADVSFALMDATGTVQVPASLPVLPFEIAWYRLTVIDGPPPIAVVCTGDGTGAPCPCGNSGGAGRGCANSVEPAGGLLAGTGLASVALDSLTLVGTGMPTSSALYFQGTALAGGGAGVRFGDGLRCASGAVLRLATRTNFGGGSQVPVGAEPSVSVRGQVPAAGGQRYYQVWYRNSDPAFCTSAFYNLTNALGIAWIP